MNTFFSKQFVSHFIGNEYKRKHFERTILEFGSLENLIKCSEKDN